MLVLLLAAALTDAQLVARATAPFEKGPMQGRHEVLGRWRGQDVVADYPCSDLCPAYTVRLVHLALLPDTACTAAGGVALSEAVPMGIATGHQRFCVPAPLAAPAVLARSRTGG